MRVSELPRDGGVEVGIATTPRYQHCQCRLVSLLTCRGPLNRGPLNTVRGM